MSAVLPDVFQKIPAGAVVDGVEDIVAVVKRRQNDHFHFGEFGFDALRRHHTVHVRHTNVHQHYVRTIFFHLLQSVETVESDADDFQLRIRFQNAPDSFGKNHLIVRYHYPDFLIHILSSVPPLIFASISINFTFFAARPSAARAFSAFQPAALHTGDKIAFSDVCSG